MEVVDRIKAVADQTYATRGERISAIQNARVSEAITAFDGLRFPHTVDRSGTVVRITKPAQSSPGAIQFDATVTVDGKLVHAKTHVVVNPPLLMPDPTGEAINGRGKFRFDPLACLVQVVLEAAGR